MATCKDCIHCRACFNMALRCGYKVEALEGAETCEDFKNKADVVELPCRCKDCKHQQKFWHEDKRMKSGGYYTYWCDENEDPFVAHVVCGEDNDFCSYGERKSDTK